MKNPISSILGMLFISGTVLFGGETPRTPSEDPSSRPDLEATPEGLSDGDWSGIRAAYERNRHAITSEPDGTYQARNPGQAWVTRFDGRGFMVTPDAGGWEWGLELEGYGEVTKVLNEGGKLSYVRGGGLAEWFINDQRGLEQGWTFSERPKDAEQGAPLQLRLGVRGGLRPQVSTSGASTAFLNSSGGAALTYGGLKAWDANGKALRVRFVEGDEGGRSVIVEVDDAGARYPLTIDPVAQQAYLKASNTNEDDLFGWAVAVSGDTVVVGAWGEDSSATGVNGDQADNSAENAGAAYVFVRNGATWSQEAYLKASNAEAGDYFGSSVAVSGDTIVVRGRAEASGATGINGDETDNSAENAGAAYVFVRSGATWSQEAYLKSSNMDAGDKFGGSVAVSGDTIVVGAYEESSSAIGINGDEADNSAENAGAAYVFVRSGTTWRQEAYLKASNTAAGDNFGFSVEISGDTVVVGAWGEDSSATGINGDEADNSVNSAGAAYVFVRSGTTWRQEAYLKASNTAAGDNFGWSVAVSGDTVVVGARLEDGGSTGVNGDEANKLARHSGAAYVFVRSGTTWSQEAYLKASNTDADDAGELSSDYFGQSVAVSGNTVVVGAYREDSSATGIDGEGYDNSAKNAGAAYIFVRRGSTWRQEAYLKASNTDGGDHFGQSVAVSGDIVVVGAPDENSSATGINGSEVNNSIRNLADFDGGGGFDEGFFGNTPVKAAQVVADGPTGSYYHLLDGAEGSGANYVSIASTGTGGWGSASFTMDLRTSGFAADGFSVAFLDVATHGASGVTQVNSVEERGLYDNSIGVGFRTFNSLATVNYNGEESADVVYDLPPEGEWGSLQIDLDRGDVEGEVLVSATMFTGPGQTGVASDVFDSYSLTGVTDLDEFRMQVAGGHGGTLLDPMNLDIDNLRLLIDGVPDLTDAPNSFDLVWENENDPNDKLNMLIEFPAGSIGSAPNISNTVIPGTTLSISSGEVTTYEDPRINFNSNGNDLDYSKELIGQVGFGPGIGGDFNIFGVGEYSGSSQFAVRAPNGNNYVLRSMKARASGGAAAPSKAAGAVYVYPIETDGDGDLTYTTTGREVTITDCKTTASGLMVIPKTIGGNPVTSIGNQAFRGCTRLTSITIPDSVTSIGAAAFFACTRLTRITIPDGVTIIGGAAFYNCGSLTSITIPDGVTSIGNTTFNNCTLLTSITIPDSVTSIGIQAFKNCSGLTSITIPDSVTSIGMDAFYNCSSLTRAIFLGVSPSMEEEVFTSTAARFTVYYLSGTQGFSSPSWQGYTAYPVQIPRITSAPPPATGQVGMAYDYTFTATSIPQASFAVTAGSLPDGLSFTSEGVISGSPTTPGTFTGTITASTGFLDDATQDFSIQISDLWLFTSGGDYGSVTGGGAHEFNTTAILDATGIPGYIFSMWSGDAEGNDNPLSVLIDSGKTITANFAPDINDDDEDGLTNYQESVVYGTDPEQADTDGDGLIDGYEAGIGRYSVVSGVFTWAQAKAAAEGTGGHLATFTSQEEWDVALSSIEPNALEGITGAWIGATDANEEGIWTWVTGEPFVFSNWSDGQPDNFSNSDVAEVGGGFGAVLGKWFDTGAGVSREGYFLEVGYATNPTIADADADGLNDGEELAAGSNPFLGDTDGDGFSDASDAFPLDLNEWLDTDGDSIGDNADPDDDNDSFLDGNDAFPFDPTEWLDTDNDGTGNVADTDDDNDSFADTEDAFPVDATEWLDTDEDGTGNNTDTDDDGDGFSDDADAFPLDLNEWRDTDGDFIGDNADPDDDNDGLTDVAEVNLGTDPLLVDTDGDTFSDASDAFPLDLNEWLDTDGDSIGDNSDLDDDNDGLTDVAEINLGTDPLLVDTDGDTISDASDAFPLDLNEWLDTDGDSIGNNADLDDDNDGLTDVAEGNLGTDPLLVDTDDDSVRDDLDTDPLDPNNDNDTDGLSNADEKNIHRTDPLIADTDGDGLTDGWEAGVGRFSIIEGSFTWNQARTHSVTTGGYLATFTSAAEWALALESLGAQALDPFAGLWIGATDSVDEGTWTWGTDEAFGFSNWGDGKPDNAGDADFAEVAGGLGEQPGTWNARPAATTLSGYLLETGHATDPTDSDTDNDGLTDLFESANKLNPLRSDSDGNGTPDGAEDLDSDGLDNLAEQAVGSSPRSSDTDGDGLDDGAEVTLHLTLPNAADTDGDDLTDSEEVNKTLTNPLLADSDDDGTTDGDEDSDADGYTNLQELHLLLTDPLDGGSRFTTTLRVTPTGDTELSLQTISGRRYVILRSTGLKTWLVARELIGTGAEVRLPMDNASFSKRYFYKVEIYQN
jgi:hypothetical protein